MDDLGNPSLGAFASKMSMPPVWAGHARGSREFQNIMLATFAVGVATFAQLYSIQGVLPALSRDLRINEAQSALSVSAATLGIAGSVLVWSALADRIGRLPAMKISLVATLIFGLAVSLAPGFESLMILRLFEGIAMGGIPAAAVTYLKEEVVPTHAALAAGMFVSGNTIGGLVGRMVAGPLGFRVRRCVGLGSGPTWAPTSW